ncbi:MAG: HAMP domain-containing histidine kinase [Balneolaceae bacterium]|nr:HAMP domain-containing histidine kinase [Balneolaceae bacterium]
MPLFKKFKQSNSLRWFFLGIGILAVIALTGMNVYSLYALQESTIESAKENRKFQLEEFTNKVRHRFYRPFRGISKLDMNDLENSWEASGHFPIHFQNVLKDALSDSLFSDIYYTPDYLDGCYNEDHPIYKFDPFSGLFTISQDTPKEVCDGFGISKSRMNTITIEDFRWNNKVAFDAHRSMTLALINLDDRNIVGHINFMIDRDHLLHNILEPELMSKFGDTEESGMVVWVRDWMQDDILLSSNSDFKFSRDKVDMRQRFPDLLDNWVLQASFLQSPAVAATNASLTRNLIVLGFAVFVLFGALVFMFINAQREREFAQRQAGFLANVTHELKTPLAVMQAAGENISDGRVTDGERLKGYGEHIYGEAIRLRKMIDKLLDVARVDSGQTLIKKVSLNIDHVLKEYYQKNRAYVESQGFSFEFNSNGKSPLVMVDPDHLETILNNLVENSIKYSDQRKEIQIGISSNQSDVKITVADKGMGIPRKAQKKVFDKFYRVENSMTGLTKGHGLGLSIVKNMVELNGGTIDLKSEVNKGSVFSITFPARQRSAEVQDEAHEYEAINIPDRVELEQYARQ